MIKKTFIILLISKIFATFSIVAVDTNTGEVGSAGGSCIGNSIIISDIHPGKGVIHTQSYWMSANQQYASELMENGFSPSEIIQFLEDNDIQNNPTTSQIRPIIKLDNMTDITGGTDLTPKLVLTNELFTISSGLNTDLGNIGLEDNSSLRTSLTENLSKLDNGGLKSDGTTCDGAAALDSIYMLFQNAADNSTTDNSTILKQSNLISLTDLADQFGVNIPSVTATGFENLPMTTARLIYASDVSGTTYTDSYENAHNILYNSVYNAKSLGAETICCISFP